MTKATVGPFSCPVCKITVEKIVVEVETIDAMYLKTAKPVPVFVTCPNGHALVAYLYTVKEGKKKKVLIRNIRPAVSTTVDAKEESLKEKEKSLAKDIGDWLESL